MQRILSKREKSILYITVAVIFLGIGFNLITETVLKKNDALNKEIAITRIKLKKYSWLLANREAIHNKYNKFAQGADLPQEKGKRSGTLVATLSELETVAKESNIRIIDLRPQAQKEADSLKKRGFAPLILPKGTYTIVCIGNLSDQKTAKPLLSELKKRYQDCFMRRL